MSFSNDNSAITNQIPLTIDLTGKEPEFRDTLTQLLKKIANTVNTKEGGLYIQKETSTSAQYFTENNLQKYRDVYRMTVDFGALPDTTTATVAHGIDFNNQFIATRIYGAATNQSTLSYLPLPYSSVTSLANNIELFIDETNVNIVTGIDRSGYTGIVVIEYLKTN